YVLGQLGVIRSSDVQLPQPLVLFAQAVNRAVFENADAQRWAFAEGENVGEALRRMARNTLERRLNALSPAQRNVITEAIAAVRGDRDIANTLPAEPADPNPESASHALTKRETEVLALVAEGRSNPEIGTALGISA